MAAQKEKKCGKDCKVLTISKVAQLFNLKETTFRAMIERGAVTDCSIRNNGGARSWGKKEFEAQKAALVDHRRSVTKSAESQLKAAQAAKWCE